MRRALAALAAFVLAVLGTVGGTTASAAPLPQAGTCSGVWVAVGSSVRCATSYSTGLAALRSAGFSVESTNGLICRINGSPETCTAGFSAYWSYWHATRRTDGTYGAWTYSNKGAGQYQPTQGDAEGWAFGDGKTPPSGRPPAAPVAAAPPPTRAPPTPPTAPAPPTPPRAATPPPAPAAGATTVPPAAARSGAAASAAPGTALGEPDPDGTTPSLAPATATPEASTLPTATPPATAGTAIATVDAASPSGPATAVFALGGLALGGVGVAWAVRRRHST